MKTIKHPSLTRLIDELIDRLPETKSFTANRADPTLVTIQELKISNFIKIKSTSSWGTELIIKVGENELVDLYIDGNEVSLRRPLSKLSIKYMRSIVKRFPVILRRQEEYFDEYPYGYIN